MKKTTFAAALLLSGSVLGLSSASAQSSAELSIRMSQVEDQMRQLIGQVEQLSFEMRQLREQMSARKMGDAGAEMAPQAPAQKKKLRTAAAADMGGQDVERIENDGFQSSQVETIVTEDEAGQQMVVKKAPPAKILGTLPGTATDDDSFAGQVLVPPQAPDQGGVSAGQVDTVALAPATGDTAETLYERSYESLLRRRFNDAEAGFRGFLDQYGNHGLAGNAQYWLGETYYVQGDYKSAAQAFLGGVKNFPKSRKGADSLLKLGLSLNRLGQKPQACSAFAALADKYPKAVEAKKRADAESKRAGC